MNRFEYNGINTAINCGAIRRRGRAGKCLKWVGLYVWLREMESIHQATFAGRLTATNVAERR